jgi:hypothetical protein
MAEQTCRPYLQVSKPGDNPFALPRNRSLTTLQQRLFKTGGPLIRHARYFVLQLAEIHLTRWLFRQILGAARGDTCVAPHVIENPTAGAGPMSSGGRNRGGVSEQDRQSGQTHEYRAADGGGAARTPSINVPERMNQLTGGAVRSVDAATRGGKRFMSKFSPFLICALTAME